MNIARPGASVMIDPAVKADVPIIMGTDVTTRFVAERITAYPNQEQRNAQQLTVTQLQAASLYERLLTLPRPLEHMPAGRWRFGAPGNPENAARLVDQLLARLAADEDTEEAEPDQADRTLPLRTASTAFPAQPALPQESTAGAETWKSRRRHKTTGLINSQASPVFRKPQHLSIFEKMPRRGQNRLFKISSRPQVFQNPHRRHQNRVFAFFAKPHGRH